MGPRYSYPNFGFGSSFVGMTGQFLPRLHSKPLIISVTPNWTHEEEIFGRKGIKDDREQYFSLQNCQESGGISCVQGPYERLRSTSLARPLVEYWCKSKAGESLAFSSFLRCLSKQLVGGLELDRLLFLCEESFSLPWSAFYSENGHESGIHLKFDSSQTCLMEVLMSEFRRQIEHISGGLTKIFHVDFKKLSSSFKYCFQEDSTQRIFCMDADEDESWDNGDSDS